MEGWLMDVEAYLSGYADGEGCFCVTFNKSKRHKFGWDIRPSFSVSQNSDRAEILRMFQDYLGCGFIRPDRSDKTLKFEVRCVSDLANKVIPHFRKYPLLSSKNKDFEIFAEICNKVNKQEHLKENGFGEIVQLALALNPSGRKKFPRKEIKI